MDERGQQLGVDRLDAAAAIIVVLVLAMVHVGSTAPGEHDAAFYLEMARRPLEGVPPAPFRFRVATPLIVALLPTSVATGFLITTWSGLVGTAMVVRRTAARATGDAMRGVAAMGLFLGSGVVIALTSAPYATDPLSMLAGAGALEYGRQRRWVAAGCVLAAGAAVRETTLFGLLPLVVWMAATTGGGRPKATALVALAAPGAIVYVVLHHTPILYGAVYDDVVKGPAEIVAWNILQPGGFGQYLVTTFVGSLGVLWLVLPQVVRRRGPASFPACSLLLVAPLLAGTLVASDWSRILGYAVIAVAPAVAVIAPRPVLGVLVAGGCASGTAAVMLSTPWVALALVAVTAAVATLFGDRATGDPPSAALVGCGRDGGRDERVA